MLQLLHVRTWINIFGLEILQLLARGDLDCTGTDNCTFSSAQKALGLHDFTKGRRPFEGQSQNYDC
jgi:hypothetical protein